MPLLRRGRKLAGPIKGVTLDVATARFSVHGSREVVFRRRDSAGLGRRGAPPDFCVLSTNRGLEWLRSFLNSSDGAFAFYSVPWLLRRLRCCLRHRGTFRRRPRYSSGIL